jgi:hypothetical protein
MAAIDPAPRVTAVDPVRLVITACAELARLPAVIAPLVAGLDAATWRQRPAPKEWSPIEIVCHLRDEEVEDFGARVRAIVEGGSEFSGIDPERWAAERRYAEVDPPTALAALSERRAASVAYLATIDPSRLVRAVEHPRAGRLSGLDLLVAWVAHDRLHLAQLTATLARLWADRWAPLRADYAGPIPYPTP